MKCNLYDIQHINESINNVINIIKKYKIDIIHTHPYVSQIVGSYCSIATGIPVVTTLHSIYSIPILEKTYKDIIKNKICVSEEVIMKVR